MIDKEKRIMRIILYIITTVFLLSGIFISFFLYESDNSSMMEDRNRKYIQECTVDIKESIDETFYSALNTIEEMAYMYGFTADLGNIDYSYLKMIEEKGNFDRIRFLDAKGIVYTSDGIARDESGNYLISSDLDLFIEGMKGNSGITYVKSSRILGEPLIIFYAPVYQENLIVGVLIGGYSEKSICKMMEASYYSYQSDSLLITSDGTILMVKASEILKNLLNESDELNNIEPLLHRDDIFDKENENMIRAAFKEGKACSFTYRESESETYGYCIMLDSIPLCFLHTYPALAQNEAVKNMNQSGKTLVQHIVFLLIAYIICLLIIWSSRYIYMKKMYLAQQNMARTDSLTKIQNRLAYDEEIKFLSTDEAPPVYSIIFFDLNYLKQTNDEKGHLAGDEMIQATADFIKDTFIENGKVFRIGGDEFVAVLYCNPEVAERLLDSFRKSIENWNGKLTGKLSISCGIAHSCQNPENDPRVLAKLADMYMYEEKQIIHSGKNK